MRSPSLGHIPPYTFPSGPLNIVKLCGGPAISLKGFLKGGYVIASYGRRDTDPGAHMAISHRLIRLISQYPHLLRMEATQGWDSSLPRDVRTTSSEVFTLAITEGVHLLPTIPPMLAQHLPESSRRQPQLGNASYNALFPSSNIFRGHKVCVWGGG